MAAKLKKSLARALNNARSAVSDTRHALKAIFRRKYTLNESTSNTITAGRDSARHVEEELVPAARTIAAFVERMAADDKMSTGGKLVERIKALFTIVESELPHAVNLDGPAVSVARIPETESIVSVERESTALASFPNAEQHSKSIEPNRLPVLPPFAPASLPPLPPGRNPAFPEPDYSGITSASSAQIKACAMAQSVHFVVRNALIENGTMVKVARSETVKKAKRAGMKSDHVAQSAFVFTTPIQLGKTSERGDASCNTDDTVMDASGKTVTVMHHRESLDSGLGVT